MFCFRGLCHDILSKNFCLIEPENFAGDLSVLRFGKFPVSHRFMDEKRGSIKFFRRLFFVAQCRKMPYGNHLVSL